MVDIAEKEFNIPIRKKAQYQTIEEMKSNFRAHRISQAMWCGLELPRQAYYQNGLERH